MDSDDPNPLSYESPGSHSTDIRIEWFEDGGVTVTIPSKEKGPPSLRGELASAAIALMVIVGALWSAGRVTGAGLTAYLHAFQRIPQVAVQQPILDVVAGVMSLIVVFMARAEIHRRRTWAMPDIVGLSSKSIYISLRGTLWSRQIKAPRKALENVELIYWERSISRHPRGVKIEIAGRVPALFCDRRKPQEIIHVANVLKKAQENTAIA